MIFNLADSMIKMKVRLWRIMFEKHYYAIKLINLLLLLSSCVVGAQPSNPSPSPNDGYPKTGTYNFSPAMSIIFVIIVVVFFVVGFFSVCASQCVRGSSSPRSGVLMMINEVNQRSRRTRHQGLEPNVIDTFPTFLYSDVKKVTIGKGSRVLECSICLNEFEDEENLRLIPKCCHVFHPECIDMWLISHVTCPVCRADLVPVPGETGTNNCNFPSRDSAEDDFTHPTWVDEEFGQDHVHVVSETEIELDSSSQEVTKSIQLSNSQRQLVEGKFLRSHSTGHSLIRPWKDNERFTLRLPQDVQKKLMKPELVRAKSNLVFPSEISPKTGYRSSSFRHGLPIHSSYEQYDHEGRWDRWGFTVAPPFFTRSRSFQASIGGDNLNNITTSSSSSKPIKTSFDWLFGGTSSKDEAGERSFARLIGKNQV